MYLLCTEKCEDSLLDLNDKLLSAPILSYSETAKSTHFPQLHQYLVFWLKSKGWIELMHMWTCWLDSDHNSGKLFWNNLWAFWEKFRSLCQTYLLGCKFVVVRDQRTLIWLYSFTDLKTNGLKKMGRDTHHADCLLRVRMEDCCIITFVAAVTKHPTGNRIFILFFDIYFKAMTEKASKLDKKNRFLVNLFVWLQNRRRSDRKNMTVAS